MGQALPDALTRTRGVQSRAGLVPRVTGRACRAVAAAAVVILVPACGADRGHASTQAADPGQATMPHGDHNPRHGGVVLMHGDLHYEVVLRRNGHYQVYFSDALRTPLPATVASMVTVTIVRDAEPAEVIGLQIAEDGESWLGDGKPLADVGATARITYELDGKAYWIDLPFDLRLGAHPSKAEGS
jgi:hypothetical protein